MDIVGGKSSGRRKAAILMVAMGVEASSQIMKSLTEEEVEIITKEIADLGQVSSDIIEKTTDEFREMVVAHEYMAVGGMDYAMNLLKEALGHSKALDIIKKALESRVADIKLAFIFGSVARRAEDRLSDIDLLVVGDITFGEIVDLISTAEGALNRELNPVVYTLAEFNKRLSEKHYFIRDILSGDKIFIVGDENELKSLVGKGLAKGT